MLTVAAALDLVVQATPQNPSASVALSSARGLVLAEEIRADLDSPPWDKSLVDGFALRSADISAGITQWQVIEEVMAGNVPREAVRAGTATRIMTGAPLPAGADCVAMVEHCTFNPTPGALGQVSGIPTHLTPGRNVIAQGTSIRAGQVVLPIGVKLRSIEIGILAEVGRETALVYQRPHAIILPTGNELVPPSTVPGPGQIRNSNGPMLAAMLEAAGARVTCLPPAPDERDALYDCVTKCLTGDDPADILVLSGGVSAGILDLVPSVLAEAGVQPVFHKISMKPGKPLWFGTFDRNGSRSLVFGLPGNPVSSLVCSRIFVRSALEILSGQPWRGLTAVSASLSMPFSHRSDRPTYHPVWLEDSPSGQAVRTLPWQGSPDLFSLTQANALALFPAGTHDYSAGDVVEVYSLE